MFSFCLLPFSRLWSVVCGRFTFKEFYDKTLQKWVRQNVACETSCKALPASAYGGCIYINVYSIILYMYYVYTLSITTQPWCPFLDPSILAPAPVMTAVSLPFLMVRMRKRRYTNRLKLKINSMKEFYLTTKKASQVHIINKMIEK